MFEEMLLVLERHRHGAVSQAHSDTIPHSLPQLEFLAHQGHHGNEVHAEVERLGKQLLAALGKPVLSAFDMQEQVGMVQQVPVGSKRVNLQSPLPTFAQARRFLCSAEARTFSLLGSRAAAHSNLQNIRPESHRK